MATKKVVAKKEEVKKAETKKEEVKKVAFDPTAFAAEIQKSFAKDEVVTVVADSDLEKPRDASFGEKVYLHFFRKNTERDLFKMYNMPKKTRFAVASFCEVPESNEYKVTPVMNTKTDKVKWINVYTGHENAAEVAKILIQASIAGAEKKATAKAEKKAAKAEEKKATKKSA